MGYSHDVCHGIPYQTREGQIKKRFTKIGAAFTNDQGQISVKLEYFPPPDAKGEIWLSLFVPKPRDGAPQQRQEQQNQEQQDHTPPADTDQIPF